MKRYISDCHFFHRNANQLDGRDFETMFEMHETMIEKWNQAVNQEDEVYILGDFSFGKGIETWQILNKLKGHLILVEGNHDGHYLYDKEFVDTIFDEIVSYGEIKDSGRNVILSHYPMPIYNHQFAKDKQDNPKTFMLYGHVHNTYDEYLINRYINDVKKHEREHSNGIVSSNPTNLINTFCVFSNYRPLLLDEWIEIDNKRRLLINECEKLNNMSISYEIWKKLSDEMVNKSYNNWCE